MSSADFVHLHCHSHFSLLDGASRLDELVERTAALGMKALALTDHGNLYGALQFYRKAKSAGVKPIIGYEAYVAPESRFVKDAASAKDAADHLTLLAINQQGFKNLIKLASLAFLEGYYYRPRIDKELLARYHEGLVCLSGCASSELSRRLLDGDEELRQACATADWFRQVFGDRYFIEVQDNGLEVQRQILERACVLSRKTGIPLVATSDVHYVRPEDAAVQDILLCVNTGKVRSDEDRMRMGSDLFYLRSPAEMYRAFSGLEDALRRTVAIADWVDLEIDLGTRHFPVFTPPDGKSSEEYLRELCLAGLKERYAGNPQRWKDGQLAPEVMERLEHELRVINKLGFANYFLVVWDFVRFARQNGIMCNARGSGVGALVAYALHLSPVCPIEHDLLFERFLDENRREAPDIDIDFCQQRRGEVIDYVKRKYGEDNVAQIGTFGTLAARAAIRDVGRALGLPLPRVNSIVALVPNRPGMTLRQALEESEELRRQYENDPAVRELVDLARQVEGLARNASTHAAGVVIADRPLTEYLPLQRVQGKEEVVTQWAMGDVEAIGLLKMDLLGLRNLTLLSKVVQLIKETTGETIDPYRLPLDDPDTFGTLRRGETKGVFQLEKAGIRELLQRMKPDHFRDIVATNALYRPGPLKGGMVDDYIDVKHGRKKPEYRHPVLEEILGETHGVMVYQEQVMRILNRLGGIPLADAYTCIKAISKKKLPIIARYREQFIEGAKAQGLKKSEAEGIFNLIEKFAGYGFNKSHATAYALISYITAYLKTHYPLQFMAALLSCDIPMRNFTHKDLLVEHLEDCRRMGIEIIWPDINKCFVEFAVVEGKIAFGLSAIKGCGEGAAAAIVAERQRNGPFRSLFDFCQRLDPSEVPRSTIEALIKAGAFDSLGASRAQCFEVLDRAIQAGVAAAEDRRAGQLALFGMSLGGGSGGGQVPAEFPPVPDWPSQQKAAFEKEVLGFYVSGHPLAPFEDIIKQYATHDTVHAGRQPDRAQVFVAGIVANLKYGRTRTQREDAPNRYATFDLEDPVGSIRCIVWPDTLIQVAADLRPEGKLLVAGTIDRRGDVESAHLIVGDLVPLEEARERAFGGIQLRFREGVHSEELMVQAAQIVRRYPGRHPVSILVELQDGIVVPMKSDSLGVECDWQLVDELQKLLGVANVKIMFTSPFRRLTAKTRSGNRNHHPTVASPGRASPITQ